MTTKEIGGLMGISAETLASVNENMDISEMFAISKEFAKQTDKLEMKQEMIADAFEMAGDGKLDEDADKFYSEILEE